MSCVVDEDFGVTPRSHREQLLGRGRRACSEQGPYPGVPHREFTNFRVNYVERLIFQLNESQGRLVFQ